MIGQALFSSNKYDWETPQRLFDQLNTEFQFTLDVCATRENTKCRRFFSPEQDGLSQPWGGEICWCNPPYGREVGKWVGKALNESIWNGATVVMLLPARTDTAWFHKYIYGKAEVRFLKGRLKFGGAKNSAPFPSMIAVFRPKVTATVSIATKRKESVQ